MIGKAVIGLDGGMFERDGTSLLNCGRERFHCDSDRWLRRVALGVRVMLQPIGRSPDLWRAARLPRSRASGSSVSKNPTAQSQLSHLASAARNRVCT